MDKRMGFRLQLGHSVSNRFATPAELTGWVAGCWSPGDLLSCCLILESFHPLARKGLVRVLRQINREPTSNVSCGTVPSSPEFGLSCWRRSLAVVCVRKETKKERDMSPPYNVFIGGIFLVSRAPLAWVESGEMLSVTAQ